MTDDSSRALFDEYCGALMGKRELDDSIVDPNVAVHLPEGNFTVGLSKLDESSKSMLAAFPDYRIEILDTLVDGDRLAARLVISGTHSGTEFFGFDERAKGRHFSADEILIVRIRGGRITDQWAQADMSTISQQLGTR